MRELLKEVGAELRRNLYAIAALGAVALAVYAYVKRQAQQLPSAETLALSLKQIVAGAPSALRDVVSGNDGSNYMTDAQMRVDAANELARKRAIAAQAVAQ